MSPSICGHGASSPARTSAQSGINMFGDDFDLAAAGKARRDPVVNTESLTDTQPGGQHLACRLDDRGLHAPTGQ
ncbi:Uncharacterised protein [Mycobacteroides abscessus subsp. abscessus]|nr:Uncharacterised protein [Mycobacteroides abscessus subsp. abscessus]